jgi:hypothetical protein
MKQLALLLLMLPLVVAAQTKKPATTKKPTTASLDVDRLYQKYKEWETVTIHTADGDITANVKCLLNDNGKPYAVILYGYAGGSVDPEKLVKALENDKLKSGYRSTGHSSVTFSTDYDVEMVSVDVYEKKTQYAKYGVKRHDLFQDIDKWKEVNERREKQGLPRLKPAPGDFFYCEVGDVGRRSTGKQEPFTF